MHTLLDLRGNIPSFIHISDGKLHDVHALDLLLPEAGSIYVMDRGYVDFTRLYALRQAGALFVTRAKSNSDAHRVYSATTDRAAGIIADQTIALDGYATSKEYPVHLRRVLRSRRVSNLRHGQSVHLCICVSVEPLLTLAATSSPASSVSTELRKWEPAAADYRFSAFWD
jgi:Transposase DDE domain